MGSGFHVGMHYLREYPTWFCSVIWKPSLSVISMFLYLFHLSLDCSLYFTELSIATIICNWETRTCKNSFKYVHYLSWISTMQNHIWWLNTDSPNSKQDNEKTSNKSLEIMRRDQNIKISTKNTQLIEKMTRKRKGWMLGLQNMKMHVINYLIRWKM